MTTATSIQLDSEIKQRPDILVEARQRSPQAIMEEATAQYVAREERRKAFRTETVAAWKAFQATGLYATAEEVEQWHAGAGSDDELPAPASHG